MEMLEFADFMRGTMGGRPPAIDLSIYEGREYDCACGQRHVFEQEQAIRELRGMRLVLRCPSELAFLTCVKIKGIFWFFSFKSLFGSCELEDD